MDQTIKDRILAKVKSHIHHIGIVIQDNLEALRAKTSREAFREIRKLSPGDQLAQTKIFEYNQARIIELNHLYSSPYFVRCDVRFEDQETQICWYFGKFQLSEEALYSWTSPAATIRFENPGTISYKKPDGSLRTGTLIRKDQYMIVNGKILFLSTESIGQPRELVYQEYFATKKTEFVLPEIVAQMEKAQDQVIRAHHIGPFVISGPAGSGKTTLALHRVAYLVQSPDTAPLYSGGDSIVFVQDKSTKEYFSHLLPELGITSVTITTFTEWAMKILGMHDFSYGYRYGDDESEKDRYEYAKLQALKHAPIPDFERDIFRVVRSVYTNYFSQTQRTLLSRQKKEKSVDRFDLTVLLQSFRKKYGDLSQEEEYYKETKKGTFQKKRERRTIKYSLVVIDEFQNYLPEQVLLIKSAVDTRKQSVVYVGDMAQQTRLGTMKSWQEIHESIQPDRNVVLQKVYRNTGTILRFIQSLGYDIQIPRGVKDGPAVMERIMSTLQGEVEYIKDLASRPQQVSIGVLAKEEAYVQELQKYLSGYAHIHVFTMNEVQGVEFEVVCLVGITKDTFRTEYGSIDLEPLADEKKKVMKDVLYVALTRAISELHILGRDMLRDCL